MAKKIIIEIYRYYFVDLCRFVHSVEINRDGFLNDTCYSFAKYYLQNFDTSLEAGSVQLSISF